MMQSVVSQFVRSSRFFPVIFAAPLQPAGQRVIIRTWGETIREIGPETAEKAFKAVTTKPVEAPPKPVSTPGVKETVTLRIDRDVLDFFQQDGQGWQDRINAALRKAAGK